jgi:hypothetical protein
MAANSLSAILKFDPIFKDVYREVGELPQMYFQNLFKNYFTL